MCSSAASPGSRPVSTSTGWPTQTGEGHFGLDHSQVRLYTAVLRHLVLTTAVLAICAVAAAMRRKATSTLPPAPISPTQAPPADPGLIPLTVAEVKQLYNLLTRTIHDLGPTTCTGPGGDAATKSAPAGTTTAPGSGEEGQHDHRMVQLPYYPGIVVPVPDRASIDSTAADLDGDLITLRRDIHRWPELAGGEQRTAALVADRLRAEGLAVSTGVGGHGVVAVLDGERGGPTIAYRADMDAVAGSELFDSDFTSQVPGAAHLCGHDIHTAIGVGIAQVLARLRHRISGRVVFAFQPAEETLNGARAMIADGVLHRTEPQEIYALHCGPSPVGTFAVMPGYGLPGQDYYDIELSGPNAAADGKRLLAAIDALSTVEYPQTPEQFEQLLGDMQTPDGPLARFVFVQSDLTADDRRAQARVWLRAWSDDRYPEIRAEVQRLTASIDGARIELPQQPFPAMVCSPELSEAAAAYLRDTIGPQAVIVLHAAFPFSGDDFALFLQYTPGAMLYLGVANTHAGINGVLHAPDFSADDRAIGVGIRAITGLLSNRLRVLYQ